MALMGIRLSRPTVQQLEATAEQSANDSLTYSPVGATATHDDVPGYRRDRWTRELGRGDDVFQRGVQALRNWEMHQRSGLIVAKPGPPAVGQVVAMAAPLPLGFIEVVCRVVAVQDELDRFGFTYGTLPRHPEQGEESFTVTLASDGCIKFEVIAVSRARHPLARAFPPVARRLQQRATNRYFDAMQSLAAR